MVFKPPSTQREQQLLLYVKKVKIKEPPLSTDKTMFWTFLIIGLLVPSAADTNVYYFINRKMTWLEAQDYCTTFSTQFDQLAEVKYERQVEAALVEAAAMVGYQGEAWIGLKKEFQDWTWVDGEPLSYENWDQLSDYGEGTCALMKQTGTWTAAQCSLKDNVICEKGKVVPMPNGNWTEGEVHCRTQGTSLVTFHNHTKVAEVQRWMQDNTVSAGWIGLRKLGVWSWYSGGEVSYTNWEDGEPNLSQMDGVCATFSSTSRTWNDENCSQLHPFFCSGVGPPAEFRGRKTMVRIQVQSRVNVEDQIIHSSLLQQLQAATRTQGAGDVKMTWTTSPKKGTGTSNEERCPLIP